MKSLIKYFIHKLIKKYFYNFSKEEILLIIHNNYFSDEIVQELNERFRFYFSDERITLKVKRINLFSFYLFLPVKKIKFYYGFHFDYIKESKLKNFLFYDVDFKNNPQDGWNWYYALSEFTYNEKNKDQILQEKNLLFKKVVKKLPDRDKAYVLGTGPSLEKAINLNWNDGYKIVCNTIVKDVELWNYLQPDFILAGDAIYHFGNNDFAIAFIEDLKLRLRETNTFFVYPFIYHSYLSFELKEFEDRLIPIPISYKDLSSISLLDDFSLPANTGNVLNLLLLPLATTLSKNVYLYGFNGRAPGDKLFWSYSDKHSYVDKIDKIIEKHPKFFEQNVPKNNESNYVKKVHGDKLDQILTNLESLGWCFIMMHETWTETLAKRFKKK